MLTREQIISYCDEYLNAQAMMTEPSSKTMGLSMAVLLSVYFNYSDEEKSENDDTKNLINGLKLAAAIDKKNIATIDPTAQLILSKLKPVVAPMEMSANFYIGTLDEAITILENNDIANNPKQVIRVFKAINIAENFKRLKF
jgi:hypothetical protein